MLPTPSKSVVNDNIISQTVIANPATGNAVTAAQQSGALRERGKPGIQSIVMLISVSKLLLVQQQSFDILSKLFLTGVTPFAPFI